MFKFCCSTDSCSVEIINEETTEWNRETGGSLHLPRLFLIFLFSSSIGAGVGSGVEVNYS